MLNISCKGKIGRVGKYANDSIDDCLGQLEVKSSLFIEIQSNFFCPGRRRVTIFWNLVEEHNAILN